MDISLSSSKFSFPLLFRFFFTSFLYSLSLCLFFSFYFHLRLIQSESTCKKKTAIQMRLTFYLLVAINFYSQKKALFELWAMISREFSLKPGRLITLPFVRIDFCTLQSTTTWEIWIFKIFLSLKLLTFDFSRFSSLLSNFAQFFRYHNRPNLQVSPLTGA